MKLARPPLYIFSDRLLWLLALGIVMISLAVIAPVFYLITIFYDLALLLLLAIDMISVWGVKLVVTRDFNDKAARGRNLDVNLRVRNLSRARIRVYLKDSPPRAWEQDDPDFEVRLGSFDDRQLAYRVVPLTRGRHSWGPVHLRLEGIFRLASAQQKIALSQHVTVYPDIRTFSSEALLLDQPARESLSLRTTLHVGEGMEFDSLRDYIPGDDTDHIDWKATARRGKLICRQYEMERNQNVIVLLDCGRLMTGVVDNYTKMDAVVNAAAVLARVSLLKGDRIGVLAFSRDIKFYLPPAKGETQMVKLMERLAFLEPDYFEADYNLAYSFLELNQKRRSLVVTFTDLISPESSRTLVARNMGLLPRYLPLCISVKNSAIHRLVSARPLEVEDVYKQVAALTLLKEKEKTLAALKGSGVIIVDAPSDNLTPATVNAYLQVKRRGLI